MTRVRRFGAIILALAAIGIFFGMAPSNETGAGDISAIMVGDTADQARAEGAPQQTVVNGWTTRSLLEVIAKQLDEGRDPRPAALLTLGVLGAALFLFTSETPGARKPMEATDAGSQPGNAVSELLKRRPAPTPSGSGLPADVELQGPLVSGPNATARP